MKFVYQAKSHWPCLSWLAVCSPQEESTIRVFHGNRVETRELWFCEAVWAGDFQAGDFDQTDIVAGSGGRIRDNTLTFVSSGSDTDRLQTIQRDGITYVSNSLVCLLNWIKGKPDINYLDYTTDFAKYRYAVFGRRTLSFPSSAGQIDLVYFSNLGWNGNHLEAQDKACGERQFDTFDDYLQFMQQSTRLIVENARDESRIQTYKLLCPLSNGYDSPTVAALLREFSGVEAFTFATDEHGADDSGEAIATMLGIPCHVLDRDAWRKDKLAEIPFLAASGSVGDLAFQPAEDLMRGAVLFTGYGGDLLWDKHADTSPPIALGGGSMLGLTEYRLWAGFINCPVGVWGIRQLNDILRVSNAGEMQPWDIGGCYSRPICRRIVETTGVPRSSFGVAKHGVSIAPLARRDDLSRFSRMDLLAWLHEQRRHARSGARRLPHPLLARLLDCVITKVLFLAHKVSARLARWRLLRWMVPPINALKVRLTRPYYHHHYRVHWAIDRAKRRYQEPE